MKKHTIERQICAEMIKEFLITQENSFHNQYRYGQAIGAIRILFLTDGCTGKQRDRMIHNIDHIYALNMDNLK